MIQCSAVLRTPIEAYFVNNFNIAKIHGSKFRKVYQIDPDDH